MANSGRKRKKADKAKVQLKKGSKKSLRLPKGLNVTDSRVSTKKILIVNQLGKGIKDEPQSKKHIGFKDLLGKLNSLSSSIRADGLDGLTDILKSDKSELILEDQLSLLIHKLAPLTNDREGKIRRLTNAIISQILNQVDTNQVGPLFPILSAHLCCGLSNIDTYIQRDSLKLLDELIRCLPDLVAANFKQILPNCLNQISTQKSSKDSRALTSNVNESISSLQWRQDVLQRVQKVYEVIVGNQQKNVTLTYKQTMDTSKPWDEYNMSLFEKSTDVNGIFSVMDVQRFYDSRDILSNFGHTHSKVDSKVSVGNNLVPLLLDTWSEAILSTSAPSSGGKSSNPIAKDGQSKLIDPDIIPVLEACVKTLKLLVKHLNQSDSDEDKIEMKTFQSVYEPRVNKQMVDNFPYTTLQKKLDKKGSASIESKADISEINLTVIELSLDLTSGKNIVDQVSKFIKYVKDLFDSGKLNQQGLVHLMDILQKIYHAGIPEISLTDFDHLVGKLAKSYPNNPKLIELFSLITLQNDHTLSCVEAWIKHLVEALVKKEATPMHRHIAKQLLKQQNYVLMKSLPSGFGYFEIMAVN